MSTKSSPVPKPLVATPAQFVPVPVQTFKNEGGVPQKNSKSNKGQNHAPMWIRTQ